MLPLPRFPVLLNWKPLLTRDLEPGITLSDEFQKISISLGIGLLRLIII
jgi:hypothetical protein